MLGRLAPLLAGGLLILGVGLGTHARDSAVANELPGRQLVLSALGTTTDIAPRSVLLSWGGGPSDAGFIVNRAHPSGTTTLTFDGSTRSYTEVIPPTVTIACYTVIALGNGGAVTSQSDTLCAAPSGLSRIGTFSIGFDATGREPFGTAILSWSYKEGAAPAPETRLIALGTARVQQQPAALTVAVDRTQGVPTCYVLQEVQGRRLFGQAEATICGIARG